MPGRGDSDTNPDCAEDPADGKTTMPGGNVPGGNEPVGRSTKLPPLLSLQRGIWLSEEGPTNDEVVAGCRPRICTEALPLRSEAEPWPRAASP